MATAASPVFTSFGRGTCPMCNGAINRGDSCRWHPTQRGTRIHATCGEAPVEAAPRPKSNRKQSKYQIAFVNEVKNGRDSLLLEAGAGSGKTTTIKDACNEIPANVPVLYVVFARKNADEAQSRLPGHVYANTFHGFCGSHLRRHLGNPQLDKHKIRNLWADMVNLGLVTQVEADLFGPTVQKLIGLAKAEGIGAITPDTYESWAEVIDHYGLEIEGDPEANISDDDAVDRVIEIAQKLLTASNNRTDIIDFDDMLYLTVKLRITLPRYSVVFVDEAQDTNKIQRAILHMALEPGARLFAVGDRRQAIYGFRGADADAMDRIATEFGCKRMPLSINYRCSKAVVRAAQQFAPELEAWDQAPEGSVQSLEELRLTDFQPTDAVLCRNTAPLITLAYRLIGAGTGCVVLGRDISEGLVALIRKMQGKRKKPLTIEQLIDKLDIYREREVSRWMAKGEEDKAQSVTDKVESIMAAINALPESQRTLNELIAHIEGLFSDREQKGLLTLCTVHKSKGLEWPNVYILNPDLMPSKWARRAWQKEQERNLQYVAFTRAKVNLFFVDDSVIF